MLETQENVLEKFRDGIMVVKKKKKKEEEEQEEGILLHCHFSPYTPLKGNVMKSRTLQTAKIRMRHQILAV